MANFFINLCRKIQIKSVNNQMKGQPLPDDVTVFSDIYYINDGKCTHTLDIYYPEGTNKLLPVVVSIHGGAFIGGDKFFNKEFCMRLSLNGYCVVNINYDLAPEASLTQMVKCVNDALLWVYRNIGKYNGDVTNIFGLGDSAGGWQVLTYSVVNKDAELRLNYGFQVENPITFKALALICPVANVKRAMDKNSKIKWFRRATYSTGTDDKNYHLTSIQDIINKGNIPNSLIITSPNDHYYYQSVELNELMNNNNVQHHLLDVKDIDNKLDHCFNIMHPQFIESVKTNEFLSEFFTRNI